MVQMGQIPQIRKYIIMTELVLPAIVASDDARFGELPDSGATVAWRRNALPRSLDLPADSVCAMLGSDPQALRQRSKDKGLLSSMRFAACLVETLLDMAVDLARSRKSQGKMLLTYQAVALRIANLYISLQIIDQIVDNQIVDTQRHDHDSRGNTSTSLRRRYAAEQLLVALRNAAQVMAGHGYVDNEIFAAIHQAALDTGRDLMAEAVAV